MGAVFAEYHFERFHSDSIDVGCIDPAHSVQRLPYRLPPAFFYHVGLVGLLQRRRGLSPLLFPFHVPEFPQDLLLIGGDSLLDRVVHLQSLLQAEQVILPPVPPQLFGNLLFSFAAAWVAQLGQFLGILFSSRDGAQNGHARHPIEVGDRPMHAHVPLVQALLHPPPPVWPYPAPASAAGRPLPPVETNPAAIRNCAAAESTRNPSGLSFCRARAPAPVAVYPRAALADLALPTPRAEQSNKLLCSPSPPTLPVALSATPPYVSVPPSSPRSWRFRERSPPRSERIPSAARSPDRSRPRSVESPVNPGAVFGCLPSSLSRAFLSSLYPTLLSTPAQAGRLWILT